jgi:hypothetical protein
MSRLLTSRQIVAECDRQIAEMERQRPDVPAIALHLFEKDLSQLHAIRNAAMDQIGAKA